MSKEYDVHPFAMKVRDHTPEEWAALLESLRKDGQTDPIELYQGKVLDGRHRLKGCTELGIKPKFKQFEGDDAAAKALVIARTVSRHFTASERAMLYVDLSTTEGPGRPSVKTDIVTNVTINSPPSEANGTQPPNPESPPSNGTPPVTQGAAADAAGVSRKTLNQASQVESDGAPELAQAVRDGIVSVSDAHSILDASKALQKKAVAYVRDGKTKTVKTAVALLKDKAAESNGKGDADEGDDKVKVGPMDDLGNPIPKSLRDTFAGNREALERSVKLLQEVRRTAKDLHAWNAWMRPAEIETTVKNLIEDFKNGLPFAICERCKGKQCDACRNEGWLTKWAHAELEVGK